ncbi:hypothetical protein TNCV_4168381 [Trichonephila clavipes]|nr:hypothetical protein TNCV_4168381 [Trichonephila clavipes]
MALYRSPLTVTLWPSSFLKKYGPMIPPAHKAHQTVSFSGSKLDHVHDLIPSQKALSPLEGLHKDLVLKAPGSRECVLEMPGWQNT